MKDLDLSAFDEDVEETELDLSAFDEEPEEELPESDVSDVNLPGYMGLKAAEEVAKDVAPEAAKATRSMVKEGIAKVPFGKLDADDVSTLYNKREKYKALKEAPGKLGDKFADFAKQLEEAGYTATKNVGDVLESQGKSMRTEDLISELETRASDISYEPDAARLKEAEDAAKGLKDAERKLAKAERFYGKKEADIADELEEIQDRIAEYKQKSFERQELNRMRDVEKQSIDEMIDKLKDEKYEYDDPTASKQINKEIDQLNRQKRKLGENLKERVYAQKVEVQKDMDIIKKLEARKKELKRELKKDVLPNKKKELARLENLRKTAEKTAGEKAIQRKALTEEAEKYLSRLKKQLSNKKTLTGQDLAKEMKRLNKQFGKPGADEIRKAFREMLGDMSKYVGESGRKATEAIVDYENILKDLPLEQTTKVTDLGKGTGVRQQNNFNRILAGIMSTEEGADLTKKADLIEMLKRSGQYDLLDEAELNKILQMTKESKASLLDVAAAAKTKGTAVAPTARSLETFGTKAQELATLGAGKLADLAKTPVAKGAAKVGKGALKTLPFIGAGLDYMEAGELGLEGPLEKGLYTAVEAVNPLPVSTGQMYEMAREAEKTPEGKVALSAIGAQLPAAKAAYETMKNFLDGRAAQTPKNIADFIKNRDNADQLVSEMRKVNEEYANRIDSIKNTSENKDEYERKISMLNSEPAFRELVRRQVRRMKDEQGDRD